MAARTKKLIAAALVALAGAGTTSSDGGLKASGYRLQQAPQRIISVVPAVTEMLFALGAGPQVVGVSSYDDYPPEVRSLTRVGALLNPDTERMLSLRPDLVILYGSQADLQAQLARAGIRTYSYRHGGLGDVFSTIRGLGSDIGRAAEGERLAREIQAAVNDVAARVQGRRPPRTLLVIEREPGSLRGLYASGGRGFLHEMLELAGGANVFADVDREAVQPSIETLLALGPDVILEIRATGLVSDPLTDRGPWQALSSLPAVRSGRVHVLSGDHLVLAGPRVAQGVEALARALHPEAFR